MKKTTRSRSSSDSSRRSSPELDSSRSPNSFRVVNADPTCHKASYAQLLKTPELMKRRVRSFIVRFATKEDSKNFEESSLRRYFHRKKNLKKNLKEFRSEGQRAVASILKEIVEFSPIEVIFQSFLKYQIPVKGEEEPHSPEEVKQQKEEYCKSETTETKESQRSKRFEEAYDLELVKKVKNEDHQYINVEIYQGLTRCKGDLKQVIDEDPELGEKILKDLDNFERVEKHVQRKIKQEIFQEWQMGIKFDEISVEQIQQSLRDKTLEHIVLRREVFFEKELELKKLERDKSIGE